MANSIIFTSFIRLILFILYFRPISSGADDTWVIVVSTSRYWFNYRHTANAVAVYKIVKSLGIADSNIILMNALDASNENRNPKRGSIHFNSGYRLDEWEFSDLEVDYTREEVSVESFVGLLTARQSDSTIGKKQLHSNSNSSILIYMAGHGGDEFFKFHDS